MGKQMKTVGMVCLFLFLLHSVINCSQLSEFLKLMPRFVSLLTFFFLVKINVSAI